MASPTCLRQWCWLLAGPLATRDLQQPSNIVCGSVHVVGAFQDGKGKTTRPHKAQEAEPAHHFCHSLLSKPVTRPAQNKSVRKWILPVNRNLKIVQQCVSILHVHSQWTFVQWIPEWGKYIYLLWLPIILITFIYWTIYDTSHLTTVETSTSALLTMPKPLTMWITINCGKFWKRWEYQTTWPASWEICMQVRKQQLELEHFQ